MDNNQRCAEVIAAAAWLNAQVEAARVTNAEREHNGSAPAYGEEHFQALIDEAGLRPDIVRQYLVGNIDQR